MIDDLSYDRLLRAYSRARETLLNERTSFGLWVGELSTSALSTAVAVSALSLVQKNAPSYRQAFEQPISRGLAWLAEHQNADGGWGDTVRSFSNISTTMLCRAAFPLCDASARFSEVLSKAEEWLGRGYGRTAAEHAHAVRERYGSDRTFSVPILMTSALAGLVGWHEVPRLPFEMACFPQSWYRFLGLPVVSYALPALIAIGQAVHYHRPPWDPFRRLLRWSAIEPSLRVLQAIQPSNGGFLEAAPLTAFVTLGLASSGKADHPVVHKAIDFLLQSIRPDGSWPIDTNLSTWVTTLAINALAIAEDLESLEGKELLYEWLLAQQYQVRHPYTGADPGAWAWTPLPGAVPDADDTPGAILALCHLSRVLPNKVPADQPFLATDCKLLEAFRAAQWLLALQNRDGGMPTFCRGWGKLPFDRSGTDLTAHALRAFRMLANTADQPEQSYQRFFGRATERAFAYLAREQRSDGSWLPLWFGNQHAADESNPTYGTARVVAMYRDLELWNSEPAQRGIAWLLSAQNSDGGWGGASGIPSSVEETALAVEVLMGWRVGKEAQATSKNSKSYMSLLQTASLRGLLWLIERVEAGGLQEPTPIGFYFAKLWYFERMYPIVWAVAALGRACRNWESGGELRQGIFPFSVERMQQDYNI